MASSGLKGQAKNRKPTKSLHDHQKKLRAEKQVGGNRSSCGEANNACPRGKEKRSGPSIQEKGVVGVERCDNPLKAAGSAPSWGKSQRDFKRRIDDYLLEKIDIATLEDTAWTAG